MYVDFYGLTEKPFNVTPDPKFLFLSSNHKEAFAHLLYGVTNRSGFVEITGEIGTGKTTLCRALLSQLDTTTNVAVVFNPFLSEIELLKTVNEDFGIPATGETKKELIDALNRYLLREHAQGHNCVLIIDEAQKLSIQVLEQIRLLSNLETDQDKLLQIILVGQPEVDEHLRLPELRQLNQRITARFYLPPLNETETSQYIAHRLGVAGGSGRVVFSKPALKLIYKHTGGIPRLINAVCDRALLAGYIAEKSEITLAMAKQAIREVVGTTVRAPRPSTWQVLGPVKVAAYCGLVVAAAAAGWFATVQVKSGNHVSQLALKTAAAAAGQPLVDAVAMTDDSIAAGSALPVSSLDAPVATAPAPLSSVSAPLLQKPSGPSLAKVRASIVASLAATPPAAQKAAAIRAALRAWNIPQEKINPLLMGGGIDFDVIASGFGLNCDFRETNFTSLRGINLPFILELDGAQSEGQSYVAVVRMSPDGECLQTSLSDEAVHPFPLEALSEFWFGKTYLVWRDFESLGGLLAMGQQGKPILKLQEKLRDLGYYSGKISGIFDAVTFQSVSAFQREHFLQVDGVVGPRTQLSLYTALEQYPIPKLIEEKSTDGAADKASLVSQE